MERKLLKTADGSYTLHIPAWNEQYHSKNGAVAEAVHVFIKNGLYHFYSKNSPSQISILEIGFGTGLNCILTFWEAQKNAYLIDYTGVDAFPLSVQEALSLNYPTILENLEEGQLPEKMEIEKIFSSLHQVPWEERISISENFAMTKLKKNFSEIKDQSIFNLIYFDAFGIRVQPDLWTEDIFSSMYNALKPKGVLVTYAANGQTRRAMKAVGFSVERLSGPPGKREMLRATKEDI